MVKLTNPDFYKTQDGLLRKLSKVSQGGMTVAVAVWLHNVKFVLINKWGWSEQRASKYVAAYHPSFSLYKAQR